MDKGSHALGLFGSFTIKPEAEDPGREPGGESLQPKAGPAKPASSLL